MKEDEVFYVGQKAFIKKGNEVLVLGDSHKKLDFPGGKIQEGEMDLAESLKREVREETSLEIKVGNPFATWVHILPAHHKNAGKKVFLIGYKCEYVGGEIKLENKFDKFSWVTKENYKTLNNDDSYFKVLDKYFRD